MRDFRAAGVVFGLALLVSASIAALNYCRAIESHEEEGETQACARACTDAQRACGLCETHCLLVAADDDTKQGKELYVRACSACADTAALCGATAQIVSRGGPYGILACETCLTACDSSARLFTDTIKQFPDDKHLALCLAKCRACADRCRDCLNLLRGIEADRQSSK